MTPSVESFPAYLWPKQWVRCRDRGLCNSGRTPWWWRSFAGRVGLVLPWPVAEPALWSPSTPWHFNRLVYNYGEFVYRRDLRESHNPVTGVGHRLADRAVGRPHSPLTQRSQSPYRPPGEPSFPHRPLLSELVYYSPDARSPSQCNLPAEECFISPSTPGAFKPFPRQGFTRIPGA